MFLPIGITTSLLVFSVTFSLTQADQGETDDIPQHFNISVIPETRIHGGRVAKYIRPYMAVMVQGIGTSSMGAGCTGTYIGGPWVLTAAHCLPIPVGVKIALGTHDIRKPAFVAGIIGSYSSRDWRGMQDPLHIGDIGLVKLDRIPPRNHRYIKPICLASKFWRITGAKVTGMGWGSISCNEPTSYVLKETDGAGLDSCNGDKRTPQIKKMCAKFYFDSGGPLMIHMGNRAGPLQIGVLSGGTIVPSTQCPDPNGEGLYTRIAGYIDWIYGFYPGVCTDGYVPPGRRNMFRKNDNVRNKQEPSQPLKSKRPRFADLPESGKKGSKGKPAPPKKSSVTNASKNPSQKKKPAN